MKSRKLMMMLVLLAVSALVLLSPGGGQVVAIGTKAASGTATGTDEDPSANAAEPLIVTMLATGDLHLGSWAEKSSRPNEPGYLFGAIQPLLDAADVLTGNLESPLSTKGAIYVPKEYTLRANPRMAAELVAAGYDYVSLANNHMMDFGPLALQETLQVLKDQGIAHSGAGMNLADARRCTYLTVKDVRFAFLSFSNTYPTEFYAGTTRPGTAPGYPNYIKADVAAAAKQADIVVVSFHWSGELYNDPKQYQIDYAKMAVDNGADIVIGHHPHVLQGIQVYKGKYIAYSLGNFLFGTYSSNKVKDSAVFEFTIENKAVTGLRFYPVLVENRIVQFRTRLHDAENSARVIRDMQAFSKRFGTVIENLDGVGTVK
ncbi:MAG TPA: capsular biosynthesis protein [Firmicutes bacterium]|nr:capsular biosynthesis protein [Bacillota bacterium]